VDVVDTIVEVVVDVVKVSEVEADTAVWAVIVVIGNTLVTYAEGVVANTEACF
jgi:hypothetical protein